MPKAKLYDELKQEALVRSREAVTFSLMVDKLEHHGLHEMAKAALDAGRHNEVERIKLQAKIDANDS